MDKTCESCVLYVREKMYCLKWKAPRWKKDYCSEWAEEVLVCGLCGNKFVNKNSVYLEREGEYLLICPECSANMHKCGTCNHGSYCDFQQNPIDIAPFIIRTVQQGPMTMQQKIPNPERIKATCMINCTCCDTDNKRCNRGVFHTCGKYTLKETKSEKNLEEV